MDWTRVILATLAAGIAATLTDWFFFGILFHEKYKANPEIWRRPGGGSGETKAIAISTVFGFLTCFCFVYLCSRINLLYWAKSWRLAAVLWLMIPVPLIVGQYLWVKIHPLTSLAHALGWLAKLLVMAAVVTWLLA